MSDLAVPPAKSAAPSPVWKINNPTGARGLIAVDKLGNKIRFFDPHDYREVAVLDARNHHELAISADHRTAYVTDWGLFRSGVNVEPGQQITIVDLEKRAIVGRIDTAPHITPHGMRFDDRNRLWAICEEACTLLAIDLVTRKVERSYQIGEPGSRPHFIEILPDCSKIYVSSKKGPIRIFDVRAGALSGEIAVPEGTEGICLSPDGARVVVAENVEQQLLVIDTASNRIVERVPLKGAVPSSPTRSRLIRIQFSPDGRHFVSSNYVSGVIHIHDGDRLSDHTMLPVAKGPQGMAFTADGLRVVVANHDSGIATIVDLAQRKIVGWFEAGSGVEALAFY